MAQSDSDDSAAAEQRPPAAVQGQVSPPSVHLARVPVTIIDAPKSPPNNQPERNNACLST